MAIDVPLDVAPGLTRAGDGAALDEPRWAEAAGAAARPAASRAGMRAAVALVAGISLCVLAAQALSRLLPDSYMTLYAGRWIAAHGIPHVEVFTAAARGRSWIDQQWLAELIEYRAWSLGGLPAVALMNAVALAAAFATLTRLMLRRGGSPLVAIGCAALALIVAAPSLFIRSQDLVLVLFVVILSICLADAEAETETGSAAGSVRRRRPRPALLLVVPLLVVWANLHGSVLLGAGLTFAYLAVRAVTRARAADPRSAACYAGLAALTMLTPLATPYGTEIVHYYRELLANQTIAQAEAEWHSPVIGQLSFVVFMVPLLIAVAASGLCLAKRRAPSPVLLCLTIITGISAAMAARNTVWFGLAAAAYTADVVRPWLVVAPPSSAFIRLTGVTAGLLALIAVGLLAFRPDNRYESGVSTAALHSAAAYADSHPCVRLLGDDAASSALLWHDPQLAGRVGFDARLEQYPSPALKRWFGFQDAAGTAWAHTFGGYQVLLATQSGAPLLMGRLQALPGARILARDARGVSVVAPGQAC